MEAKYCVGDTVVVNERYLREGNAFFRKELRHRNYEGKIVKVHENSKDEKDGQGDVWQNFYDVEGDFSICESFLKMA